MMSMQHYVSDICMQVRLQLQSIREASGNAPVEHKYRGPLQTVGRMIAEEGPRAPFKVCHAQSWPAW